MIKSVALLLGRRGSRRITRMAWHTLSLASIVVLANLLTISNSVAAEANRPAEVCKPGITNDSLIPLPLKLVDQAKELFRLDMTNELIRKSTVYRCVDGRTLLCATGANLACGKANVSRDLPGIAGWCRHHQDTDAVPMFVTGHDTIYRWRCSNGTASILAVVETVDARGFLSRNWKDAGS
jgi:hypothetical protein